ncbi:MAG TPA: hypothetical protein VLB12_01350 [Gemmatimonadales bacterium]|nr:hypothetical protein [Gemmatimonadales bacterium]
MIARPSGTGRSAERKRCSKLETASLIVAPALMSAGDLMHPPESWDAPTQVAIITGAATRWYWAHLLLFTGILLFVPGILILSRIVAVRRPAVGYASRVLVLASVGALAAVFACEMVLGVFAASADQGAAVLLIERFNSRVLMPLLPGLLAFFVGTGLFVAPLASTGGPLRWPARCFGLGALLILGEIVTAQVILSQIGNVLILLAGVGFARVLSRDDLTPTASVAAELR